MVPYAHHVIKDKFKDIEIHTYIYFENNLQTLPKEAHMQNSLGQITSFLSFRSERNNSLTKTEQNGGKHYGRSEWSTG